MPLELHPEAFVSGDHNATRTILILMASNSTQDVILGHVAAKGHFWVCGPAAAGVCVDICGPYHLRHTYELSVRKSEGSA